METRGLVVSLIVPIPALESPANNPTLRAMLCLPHLFRFPPFSEAPFSVLPAFRATAERFSVLSSDVTSEESHVICNIYDRSEDTHSYLGTVQIKPTLVHDHTVDQWYKYVMATLDLWHLG